MKEGSVVKNKAQQVLVAVDFKTTVAYATTDSFYRYHTVCSEGLYGSGREMGDRILGGPIKSVGNYMKQKYMYGAKNATADSYFGLIGPYLRSTTLGGPHQ